MFRSMSLLVVDDEPDIREMVLSDLAPFNAETHEAGDGREALAVLKGFRIDVAVVDLRMPDVDGLEVLSAFRRESPDTVCVVLSASRDPHHMRACLREGAYDFIDKPYAPVDLFSTMRRAFEKARFQAERRDILELMVLEYAKIPPKTFQAMDWDRKSELLRFVAGILRMRIGKFGMGA